MAWAQEMGSLVRDLKTSHRDRTHFVNTSRKDTRELLAEYKRSLKEMADDLRDMLNKSEASRKHDFKPIMEGIHGRIKAIQARVKEVRGDTQDFLVELDKAMKELAEDLRAFLSKSESSRKQDFKAMIDAINKDVASVRKSARDMIGDFRAEHKEARAHWASLPERETATEKAEEAAEAAEERHASVHKKK